MATRNQVAAFENTFAQEKCWNAVMDDALAGNFRTVPLRSVLWRAACGLLPLCGNLEEMLVSWPTCCQELRKEYEMIKKKVVANPHENDAGGDPLSTGDPLSDAPNNPWAAFHKDKELLDEITKDLERLYPNGCDDFFAQPNIAETVRQALFVWCKLHPDTSYRQGMHELAAPIMYCAYNESIVVSNREKAPGLHKIDDLLCAVLDRRYIEHDLFWMLHRVMQDMEPLFFVSKEGRMTHKELQKAKQALLKRSKEEQLGVVKSTDDSGLASPVRRPIILELASDIQNNILKHVDGALHQHLLDLNIEPQIYALRWLRLLFGREFDMEGTMVLWDAMFVDAFEMKKRLHSPERKIDVRKLSEIAQAEGFSVEQVDTTKGLPRTASYFAASMLTYMRKELLHDDYCMVLQSLMKFPEVSNPHVFVHLAFNLRNSMDPSFEKTFINSSATSNALPLENKNRPEQSQKDIKDRSDPTIVIDTFKRMNDPRAKQEPSVISSQRVTDSKKEIKQTESLGERGRGNSVHIGGKRDQSPNPIENFFKEIGERIENIFEKNDEITAKAVAAERKESQVSLESEVARLRQIQSQAADWMAGMVDSLEETLTADKSKEETIEDFLFLATNMKQVRDFLAGKLKQEDCQISFEKHVQTPKAENTKEHMHEDDKLTSEE